MPPKFKFSEGERVFCFHGPLLYEAKCIKISDKAKDKVIKYLVHYQGWNKNWDEWVPESRVLKYNDQNLLKQKELQDAHNLAKSKGKGEKRKKTATSAAAAASNISLNQSATTSSTENVPSPSTSGKTKISQLVTLASTANNIDNNKKRKLDAFVEGEEAYSLKLEVKIKIPDELKIWLIDDWDLITRQKKLFNLPARIAVDQIIEDYIGSKRHLNKNKESALIEVTNGIKEYFNVMLGSQLLYRFERPQYKQIIDQYGDETNMSSIYGGIYLLRLFVKLGSNLVFTTLDEKSIQLILTHIHDFLKFLTRNLNYFSHNDYIVSTPEYNRKAVQ